jgi:hypothetical protein
VDNSKLSDQVEAVLKRLVLDPLRGCWIWQGARSTEGYGYLVRRRKGYLVHRVIYEGAYGRIEPGFEVHHLCGVRCCANPFHLLEVDRSSHKQKDYQRDPVKRLLATVPATNPVEFRGVVSTLANLISTGENGAKEQVRGAPPQSYSRPTTKDYLKPSDRKESKTGADLLAERLYRERYRDLI